ncbi:MAG TPA: excinuclease ABC subunit UvrA [Clostridiales bacterium]|nr:excinuclease ABC subunit UvrA [Clostridiales bacterium]
MQKDLVIRGARENNLKGIDVTIPRDRFVVLTGLSGSGKSSLAFDTIYAEGQRRYVESLSAYSRQFLGQLDKPDVESIEGLSPAISIDQKTTSKNPRSTVGTVTEIYDYLRLMYARIGIPHCPVCGREISSQSVDQIVEQLMALGEGTKVTLLAPVVRKRKGEHEKILDRIRREGFVRARIDGEIRDMHAEEIKLEKTFQHTIEIVVDRIVIRDGQQSRLAESVELALAHGEGLVQAIVETDGKSEELVFSSKLACPEHGVSLEEMEPRSFSFNSPFGACPECHGLGFIQKLDPELVVSDPKVPIFDGALANVFSSLEYVGFYRQLIRALAEDHGVDTSLPYEDLPEAFRNELLWGTGGRKLRYTYISRTSGNQSQRNDTFEGVMRNLQRRYEYTNSDYIKEKLESYMRITPCDVCKGKRLKPEILAVTVGGINIVELTDLSVIKSLEFMDQLENRLSEKHRTIARMVLKEIHSRLAFLRDVGLDYLTLSRSSASLSGGEAQRIRLATQIGSSLVGILYILDEPSIGLHQKDNAKLLQALRELTDLGNTLIVVEHDEETMLAADEIIDIGPGAGIEGGYLVAQGTLDDIKACPDSITGQYLTGALKIEIPNERRKGNGKELVVRGARENNLKDIDVHIPLGKMVCVTGVSGSGKSSLINEILYKALARSMYRAKDLPGAHAEITGMENIDKVVNIDQTAIGRTPRSNPATYTGVFTPIRDLFAQTPEAKLRGYNKGRFSFNLSGGRCEACKGDGIIKIEMNFLPDVYVPCEVCKGKRYNRETLEVKYKGMSIFDVLNMTVDEALPFFEHIPSIARHIQTLQDVGLGYIKLGQPSTQLSGGEAQRVKLATELARRSTGNTLYILDEPTTGLHFADVSKLIEVLSRLADAGNTVVVIEHNLDVIKTADHIIDLGPDGGDRGGNIVVTGTPEAVALCPDSYTGDYLKRILRKEGGS